METLVLALTSMPWPWIRCLQIFKVSKCGQSHSSQSKSSQSIETLDNGIILEVTCESTEYKASTLLSNIIKGNIHLNLNIIVKWTVWRIFYWLWYKPRVVQHVRSRLKGLLPGLSFVKMHLEPQQLGVSGTQKLVFSVRALLNVNHEHICVNYWCFGGRTISTPSPTFYCCDFRTCTWV